MCLQLFLVLQRKVNSTGRCVSIVMQLSTAGSVCLITSGHMQDEKEPPYSREPVSPTHGYSDSNRVFVIIELYQEDGVEE